MRLLVISDPEDSAPLLLRVLAGLARPDGGSTELAGLTDASRAGWARRVAYVGPEQGLWPWMTPREVLALAERLHGAPGWHVDRLVTALGIGAALNQPLSWGSEAMVERVALAAALLRDPEVLLLDEPLPSLDPEERSRILSLPGRRRTILLASRQPATEAGHCTHVALLREGGLAFLATVAELAARDLPLSVRGVEALAVA